MNNMCLVKVGLEYPKTSGQLRLIDLLSPLISGTHAKEFPNLFSRFPATLESSNLVASKAENP